MRNPNLKNSPIQRRKDPRTSNLSSPGYKSLYGAGKWQKWGVLAAVFFLITLGGCGTIKKVEVEHRIETHYIDSTIYHLDTLKVEVPKEVYRDYTGLLDTLRLETGVASSWAAVDTSNMVLKGEIRNKQTALEKEIRWKERIVYKDSLVYKEVPVPVEVEKKVTPKWAWFTLGISIIFFLIVLVKLLRFFKIG